LQTLVGKTARSPRFPLLSGEECPDGFAHDPLERVAVAERVLLAFGIVGVEVRILVLVVLS